MAGSLKMGAVKPSTPRRPPQGTNSFHETIVERRKFSEWEPTDYWAIEPLELVGAGAPVRLCSRSIMPRSSLRADANLRR